MSKGVTVKLHWSGHIRRKREGEGDGFVSSVQVGTGGATAAAGPAPSSEDRVTSDRVQGRRSNAFRESRGGASVDVERIDDDPETRSTPRGRFSLRRY